MLLVMLLVSWSSLLLQGFAAAHLWKQHSTYRAEKLAGHGYVRTAACRVLAASIYSAVALLAVLNVHIPGAGALSPEAVFVFTGVQIIWLTNSLLDIKVRSKLRDSS